MTLLIDVLCWVILINFLCWPLDEHAFETERITKIGTLCVRGGIEAQESRDIDLTIQIDPRWYVSFQLSLWCVYIGFYWSRVCEEHPDCDHQDTECYACGHVFTNEELKS